MNSNRPVLLSPTRGALLAGSIALLALAAAPAFRAQEPATPEESRAVIDRWVEARRLLSQEERDWQLGREVLADRIALMEREIEAVRARIAEAQGGITEADRKREELLAASDRLKRTTALHVAALAGLEEQALALLARLPEPIRERVRPLSQRIPTPGAESRLGLGERFQNLIGVMNEVDKFHRDVSLVTEVRKLADGRTAEVATVYLGVGQAYYATADGTAAGFGTATDGGWEWFPADAAAPQILQAIAILKNEQVAAYVDVPVRIN